MAEAAAGEKAVEKVEVVIPEEWRWPREPFEPEDLSEYVLEITKATSQEEWNAALEARALDSKLEDHVAERAFANLMLNKEGTGEEKDGVHDKGIDPNAYKAGRWYRFLNNKGDCYVYVHNYTRDITATRPENFTELTDEEKKKLARLGTFIKEIPKVIERIYDQQKALPIIFASEEACEALKNFYIYDKAGELLDTTKLKRVNAKALEDSRHAMVNAMKMGKVLCVFLGDYICDFQEKICISKNRDTFPLGLFQHGALENEMTKEKIYRDEDKEGGQCVVRDGFRVVFVLQYDSMMYEMSSMRKEELPSKIPNFSHMEVVKCYNEADKKKILAQMRGEAPAAASG